ncbi:hypothetical protein L9F63_006785, partial [Diploptera punctata]
AFFWEKIYFEKKKERIMNSKIPREKDFIQVIRTIKREREFYAVVCQRLAADRVTQRYKLFNAYGPRNVFSEFLFSMASQVRNK